MSKNALELSKIAQLYPLFAFGTKPILPLTLWDHKCLTTNRWPHVYPTCNKIRDNSLTYNLPINLDGNPRPDCLIKGAKRFYASFLTYPSKGILERRFQMRVSEE